MTPASRVPKKGGRVKFRAPANLAGVLGLALFGAAIVSFAFLLLVELAQGRSDPYVGLVHYLVLPIVGTGGLALWVLGIWLERQALAPAEVAAGSTWLDLSQVKNQQSLLLITGGVGAGLVFMMAAVGIGAIEYTESEAFCGEVCHTVMEPEYVAYQNSPHARIACVDCHVGSGVASYVEAKVQGIRQVVSVVTGSYPRPIPTPIHMRTPAETCETCHWASYNVGSKPKTYRYYLTEGFETPWVLEMSLKVGGGDRDSGFTQGAHWHMGLDNEVEYAVRDARRQEIAWVRFTGSDGRQVTYENQALEPLEEGADHPGTEQILPVDCLTCHTRPAHRFASPVQALNREFGMGTADPDIPGLRWQALELLAASYETSDEAAEAIDTGLREGLEDEDPDYFAANRDKIQQAIGVVQRVFATNRFPEMRVRWDAYPDNIRHCDTLGCFRCHAGNMVADDGSTVSSSCDTCHLVKGQGRPGESWEFDPGGLAFVHPGDEDVMDSPTLCIDCHDGSLGW